MNLIYRFLNMVCNPLRQFYNKKHKFISLLFIFSFLCGTIGASAISINFEDMESERIEENVQNELKYDFENYKDFLVNEIILNENSYDETNNNISLLSDVNNDSLIGYFTDAESITYKGENSTIDSQTAVYTNTSINNSKYVIYSNAVNLNGRKYDLVVYPFKETVDANIVIRNRPIFILYRSGYAGYKLKITQHGDINTSISAEVMFGMADLDYGEYIIVPSSLEEMHKGTNVLKSTSSSPTGIKYYGNTGSDVEEEIYNKNCVFGKIYIPTDGITVYYGTDTGQKQAPIAFDEIKNYIDNHAYQILFNVNGGNGSIPSSIIKLGDNSATVLGNIGSNIPTRNGYTFKGWSASPELNDKRVAHTTGNTGATQTNSSWTYTDYCNYTGGNTSNRTLTLYAQWQTNTSNLTINPNGGIWNNSTDKQTFTQDYNSIRGIPIPIKEGYTFVKWNQTGNNGTMNSLTSDAVYTFGSTDGATDTLTAEWKAIDYNITYNLNDGTVSKENPITYTIETETFTLNNPDKEGYTFLGWTGSNGNTPQKTVSIPKGSIGDKNYIANYQVNQYPVIYIDVDSNGNEINIIIKLVDYDTLVKGSELGDDTSDNAYYPQYKYVSDTSDKVTTEGAIVYRVFEFCETEAEANLKWNDNNNLDGFRPSKYKLQLKQNGIPIDEVELPSDTTNYTFPNLLKYDSLGNPYKYSFDVDATERYSINFDEDGNLIVEDYQPASFSVIIPKTIVLNGETGNTNYAVSVNGTFYYNDTLTVTPEDSLTLTDRSNISSMEADILLNKTVFTKEDNVSEGITTIGSIQTERQLFAGSWEGSFNFNIHFEMKN